LAAGANGICSLICDGAFTGMRARMESFPAVK
jgi:hypothetical protein